MFLDIILIEINLAKNAMALMAFCGPLDPRGSPMNI